MADGKNLVGVDIGSSSIKVCQLKEGRKGIELVRLGYEPLPAQTIVDNHVMNSGAVVESLSRIFKDQKIKTREIAMSVSGQSVIIRKITVPMMTPAELAEQIQWEAEQHIPFDIKDVQIDYEVLRRRPEASQTDLLLVAAKRDDIHDYSQLARDAKLKPIVVDIDAFTIQNLFEFSRGLPAEEVIADQRGSEPHDAQHRCPRRVVIHPRHHERRQPDKRRDSQEARYRVRAGRVDQMRRP
jgi:type IV pilus assembly protein PilM